MPVGPPNPIAIGDIIQYKLTGDYLGRPSNLVLNYRVFVPNSSTTYVGQMLDILAAFHGGAIETAYLACLPTTWTLVQASVQRISELLVYPPVRSRAIKETRSAPGTWPTVVSDQPACAGIIQRYTYHSGKTEQGDLHIGPLANNAAVLGKISAGMLSALGALVTPVVSNVTYVSGGILNPVFYRTGTKAAPHQPTYSNIFGGIVGVKIATERRRGLKIFG